MHTIATAAATAILLAPAAHDKQCTRLEPLALEWLLMAPVAVRARCLPQHQPLNSTGFAESLGQLAIGRLSHSSGHRSVLNALSTRANKAATRRATSHWQLAHVAGPN